MKEFPSLISLTVTNTCNLKCRMCGQWGETGYMTEANRPKKEPATLNHWKRIIDEAARYKGTRILIRGGEPFFYPPIMELLGYIKWKGLSVSIDTNGTLLKKYAKELSRLKIDHLTISVDGPEELHDEVRGVPGCFAKIKEGVQAVLEQNNSSEHKISLGITFTISSYSYKGLGRMPETARSLGINSITIVPGYYINRKTGEAQEEFMQTNFGCAGETWKGFHRETSGVDGEIFLQQLKQYNNSLEGIQSYPYMPLTEKDYLAWFSDCNSTAGTTECFNVRGLLDIQPDGSVNFCVDFPDYIMGNMKEKSLKALWDSQKAKAFRDLREKQAFPVCLRCGAKHMGRD